MSEGASQFIVKSRRQSISTIRGYRSVITATRAGFPDGLSVSNAPQLSMLLRSFFLELPPTRSLAPSWNLPKVLNALTRPPTEPMSKFSLLLLTIKTLLLIAKASGQRRSSHHTLCFSPGHIRWERHFVRLIPTPIFLAKNQSVSSGPVSS